MNIGFIGFGEAAYCIALGFSQNGTTGIRANDAMMNHPVMGKQVHARAEEAGQDKAFREQFDIVTSRAVAQLQVLSELCIPFAKVKGTFLAMKGPEGHAEMTESLGAIRTLGGRVQEVLVYELTSAYEDAVDETALRSIVFVKKKKKTPYAFPRRGDRIKKVPLV